MQVQSEKYDQGRLVAAVYDTLDLLNDHHEHIANDDSERVNAALTNLATMMRSIKSRQVALRKAAKEAHQKGKNTSKPQTNDASKPSDEGSSAKSDPQPPSPAEAQKSEAATKPAKTEDVGDRLCGVDGRAPEPSFCQICARAAVTPRPGACAANGQLDQTNTARHVGLRGRLSTVAGVMVLLIIVTVSIAALASVISNDLRSSIFGASMVQVIGTFAKERNDQATALIFNQAGAATILSCDQPKPAELEPSPSAE